MGYYDSLAKMINKSGLTLKELSLKCEEYGVKVAPSYISKLQTKKQAPASDEINAAIAKVCEVDEESFLYESYIEKAPMQIKKLQHNLANWFREYMKLQIEAQHSETISSSLQEFLNEMSEYELFEEVLKVSPSEMNDEDTTDEKIGYSATMLDNSMEPKIPNNADFTIAFNKNLKNGDIVAALVNNEITVRRYVDLGEGKIALLPENLEHEVYVGELNNIKLIGKVGSVHIKL